VFKVLVPEKLRFGPLRGRGCLIRKGVFDMKGILEKRCMNLHKYQ